MGKIVIVDAITGEVVEREQTPTEKAQSEADRLEAEARIRAWENQMKVRESARTKLASLGLNESEIIALLGA